MITIQRTKATSGTSLADINELLLQLRQDQNEPLGTQEDLDSIASPNRDIIFVTARDGEKIVGMASIYVATKFGKKTGFVEDVVVSERYRGQGLGQRIMETAIEEAKIERVTQLYLTSRPERVAAHKLYEKLGFVMKKTDVFKLKF